MLISELLLCASILFQYAFEKVMLLVNGVWSQVIINVINDNTSFKCTVVYLLLLLFVLFYQWDSTVKT